ncbi:unnamed protein product, partial [Sphacelaria rigidula]
SNTAAPSGDEGVTAVVVEAAAAAAAAAAVAAAASTPAEDVSASLTTSTPTSAEDGAPTSPAEGVCADMAISEPEPERQSDQVSETKAVEENGESNAATGGAGEGGPDEQDMLATPTPRTTRRTAAMMLEAGESDSGGSPSGRRATRSGRGRGDRSGEPVAVAVAAARERQRGRGRPPKDTQQPEAQEKSQDEPEVGDGAPVPVGSADADSDVVGAETQSMRDENDEKLSTGRGNGESSTKDDRVLSGDGISPPREPADEGDVQAATADSHPVANTLTRRDSSESTDTEDGGDCESKGAVDGSDGAAVEDPAGATAAVGSFVVGDVGGQSVPEIVGQETETSSDTKEAVGDGVVAVEEAVAGASEAAAAPVVDPPVVVGVAHETPGERTDVEGDQHVHVSSSEQLAGGQQPSPEAMDVSEEQDSGDAVAAASKDPVLGEAGTSGNEHGNVGSSDDVEIAGMVKADGEGKTKPENKEGNSSRAAADTGSGNISGLTQTGNAADTTIDRGEGAAVEVAEVLTETKLLSSSGMDMSGDYREEEVLDFEALSEGHGEPLTSDEVADMSTAAKQVGFSTDASPIGDAVVSTDAATGSTMAAAQAVEGAAGAADPPSSPAETAVQLAGGDDGDGGDGDGGSKDAGTGDGAVKTDAPRVHGASGAEEDSSEGVATRAEKKPADAAADAAGSGATEASEGAASALADEDAVTAGKTAENGDSGATAVAPATGEVVGSKKKAVGEGKSAAAQVRRLHGTGLSVVVKKNKSKEKKGPSSKKSSKASGDKSSSVTGDAVESGASSSKSSKAKKKEAKSGSKSSSKVSGKAAKAVAKAGLKAKAGTKIGSKVGAVEKSDTDRGRGTKVLKGRGKTDKE